MNIHRLQHASIPIPPGANDEARRFLTGLLGIREIPIPSSMQPDCLMWFSLSDDGDELHVFVQEDFQPNTTGQHFCLVVLDLAAMKKTLEEAGFDIGEEPHINHRPRFSFRDPFGNKIEMTEINGDYLDAEH